MNNRLPERRDRLELKDVFERETKYAPMDLKSVNQDGSFEGYASLFDKEDLGHDVVLKGAFRKSLATRGAQKVKMLFQHDPNEPIGLWQVIKEDEKGLYVQGQLMSDVARGREVLSLMRAGAMDGLSIGFKTIRSRRDDKTKIRYLQEIDLWEISVVTFPMLSEARVRSVKNRSDKNNLPTEREFERWLMRDAGFTRSQARILMCAGFKALAAKQDAAGGAQSEARLAELIRQAAALMR